MVTLSFFFNENAPESISKEGFSYGYFEFEYFVWRKLLDFYHEINPQGAKELLELTFSCEEDDYDDDDPNGGCVPYSAAELQDKLLLLFELRDAVAANKDLRFWSETPWVGSDDDEYFEYDIESDMDQRELLWVMRTIIVIFEHAIEIKLPFTVYPDLYG